MRDKGRGSNPTWSSPLQVIADPDASWLVSSSAVGPRRLSVTGWRPHKALSSPAMAAPPLQPTEARSVVCQYMSAVCQNRSENTRDFKMESAIWRKSEQVLNKADQRMFLKGMEGF